MRTLIKLFAFASFIGAAVFPIYAFASTDAGIKAYGEGTSTISGWTTSNIHYQLADNPSFVNGVSFDLDGPAGTVSVKLSSTSPDYTSCTNVQSYHWECQFASGIRISGMDEFRVVAVGN